MSAIYSGDFADEEGMLKCRCNLDDMVMMEMIDLRLKSSITTLQRISSA